MAAIKLETRASLCAPLSCVSLELLVGRRLIASGECCGLAFVCLGAED